MSNYDSLKTFEKKLLSSLYKGKNPAKLLREFATKLYQDGFKDGMLDSNNSWWEQMDKDTAYISAIAKTDEEDNAKEWDPI